MVSSSAQSQTLAQTTQMPAVSVDPRRPHSDDATGSDYGIGAFIRHPSGLPIRFRRCQHIGQTPDHLNQSSGGLCFLSKIHVPKGTILEVSIHIRDWTYRFVGRVIRTCRSGTAHELWVCFGSHADAFQARMAEQICHIEAYRNTVRNREGRAISAELAAREWVAKYAACFPAV
jgi:hypothetical protein